MENLTTEQKIQKIIEHYKNNNEENVAASYENKLSTWYDYCEVENNYFGINQRSLKDKINVDNILKDKRLLKEFINDTYSNLFNNQLVKLRINNKSFENVNLQVLNSLETISDTGIRKYRTTLRFISKIVREIYMMMLQAKQQSNIYKAEITFSNGESRIIHIENAVFDDKDNIIDITIPTKFIMP